MASQLAEFSQELPEVYRAVVESMYELQTESAEFSSTLISGIQWAADAARELAPDLNKQLSIKSRIELLELYTEFSKCWSEKYLRDPGKSMVKIHRCISNLEKAKAVPQADFDCHWKGVIARMYWQSLEVRWQRSQSLTDMIAALDAAREALPFLEDSPLLARACRYSIGLFQQRLYDRTGGEHKLEPEMLLAAISSHRELLSSVPPSDAQRCQYYQVYVGMHLRLRNLSARFEDAFWDREVLSLLNQSISCAERGWKILSQQPDPLIKATSARSLGNPRRSRFDYLGHFTDLEDALKYSSIAIIHTFDVYMRHILFISKAMRLADVSSFHDRTDRLDEARDLLKGSIDYSRGKNEIITRNVGSGLTVDLYVMSRLYRQLHERRKHRLKNNEYLDQAISYAKQSLECTTDYDPGLSAALDELAISYFNRFLTMPHRRKQLDLAVRTIFRSVGLAEHNYSNIRSTMRRVSRFICASVAIAGDILAVRYVLDHNPSDLDGSIHAGMIALQSVHNLHPNRSFHIRALRDRLKLKLISFTPDHHQLRITNLLRRWSFLASQSSSDWLNTTVFDLQNLRHRLSLHGCGNGADLLDSLRRPPRNAIILGDELLYTDFCPIKDPRGFYPSDLRLSLDKPCLAFQERLKRVADRLDPDLVCLIDRAVNGYDNLQSLQASWHDLRSKRTPTIQKLDLLLDTMKIMIGNQQWRQLWEISEHALKLLRNLDLHLLDSTKFKQRIRRLPILATLVASVLLRVNHDPWDIVLALDIGREAPTYGIMPQTQSRPFRVDPDLLSQAKEIALRLQQPSSAELEGSEPSEQGRHVPSVADSKEFIQAIRDVLYYDSALRPYGKADCMKQAQFGFIVILVSTPVYSGAIIITTVNARAVPLPGLCYEEVLKRSTAVRASLEQCERKGRLKGVAARKLNDLLAWLWEVLGKPLVAALNLQPGRDVDTLPRIQWIPCGILSQMPVHAAGIYNGPDSPNLARYAVSSYLSSIKYAVDARRKATHSRSAADQNSRRQCHMVLTIAMPTTEPTPDGTTFRDLNTDQETRAIGKALQDQSSPVPSHFSPCSSSSSSISFALNRLVHPEMGTLISLLSSCSIAHFSCHGLPHKSDATLSRLVIWREAIAGDGGGVTGRPLTVRAIADLQIPFARLAFISACHSAYGSRNHHRAGADRRDEGERKEVGDDDDNDEEMEHVVKAFQHAGFPSVVGTLWQAYDANAITVSGSFYAYIARRMSTVREQLDEEEEDTHHHHHDEETNEDGNEGRREKNDSNQGRREVAGRGRGGRTERELNGDLFARALHYAIGKLREEDSFQSVDWASWVVFSSD